MDQSTATATLAIPHARDREHRILETLMARSRTGRAEFALLRGPAGSGKSALLREVLGTAVFEGVTVLRATGCWDPLRPGFDTILQLIAPLAESTGVPIENLTATGSDDPATVYRTFHAAYRQVVAAVARGPLVMAVDNVHLCDEPSVRWLDFLIRRVAHLPLFLVLTRDTGAARRSDSILPSLLLDSRLHVLDLRPPGHAEIAALVTAELGEVPSEPFVRACTWPSDDAPVPLTRLLRELRRRSIRPDEDGAHWVGRFARAAVAGFAVPRLLGESHGLVTESRSLWQVAGALAVLGETDTQLLSAVAEVSAETTVSAVQRLRQLGLLCSGRLQLIDDAATHSILATLSAKQAGRLRVRAAELLADLAHDVDRAADLLLQVPDQHEAWMVPVLREAASGAQRRGTPAAAARYLRRAAAVLRTSPVIWAELAEALQYSDPVAAITYLRRGLATAGDARQRAALAVRLAFAAMSTVSSGVTVALMSQVHDDLRAAAGPHPSAADRELTSMVEAARLSVALRDPRTLPDARKWAAQLPAGAGDSAAQRRLITHKAVLIAMDGGPAEVVADLARRATRIADPASLIMPAGLSAAVLLHLCDESGDAVAELGRIVTASRTAGATHIHDLTRAFTALIRLDIGDLTGAVEDMAAVDEMPRSPATVMVRYARATIQLRNGRPEQALALLGTGDGARSRPSKSMIIGHLDRLVRSTALRQLGRNVEALQLLRECGRSLARFGIENPVFMPWWFETVELLVDLGRPDKAAGALAYGERAAARWGTRRGRGLALMARGLLSTGTARTALLAEASAVLADSPARADHARAEHRLGLAHLASSDAPAARRHLQRAIELAVRAGHPFLAGRSRQVLIGAGGRPRVRTHTSALDLLTSSEQKMVTLAVDGLTNRQIAEAAFVTVRTVELHLTNAYRKLGISGRPQLGPALATTVSA